IRAECVSVEADSEEKVRCAWERADTVICISALPPDAAAPARYLYKRLRAKCPDAKIVIGLWTARDVDGHLLERVAPDGAARLASTVAEASVQIRAAAAAATPAKPPKDRAAVIA